MLRIFAAAGAAMICTAAGAVFSSALKQRCIRLRELISLTDEMSARIRYSAEPLRELTDELSGSAAYKDCTFLKRVNAELMKGVMVQDAWVTAAKSAPFFSQSDRDILTDIGARLGNTDTEGQLSMLSLASEQLGRALEEAERDCTQKAGALFRVWTLCGIGAGIILI